MRNVQFSDALATKRALGLKTVTRRLNTLVRAGDVVYHGEALVRMTDAGFLRPVAGYRRDRKIVDVGGTGNVEEWGWQRPVQIARYCPTRCARLFSLVREVRFEAVSAITEEQAIAEGMEETTHGWIDPGAEDACYFSTALGAFRATWERIYSAASWSESAYVLELGEPITRADAEWLAKLKRGTTLEAWAKREGQAA